MKLLRLILHAHQYVEMVSVIQTILMKVITVNVLMTVKLHVVIMYVNLEKIMKLCLVTVLKTVKMQVEILSECVVQHQILSVLLPKSVKIPQLLKYDNYVSNVQPVEMEYAKHTMEHKKTALETVQPVVTIYVEQMKMRPCVHKTVQLQQTLICVMQMTLTVIMSVIPLAKHHLMYFSY